MRRPTCKRTPLYDIHRALGGKMVPFAGWEMPVQYPTGIIAEHQAVRTGVGIFDVSHMGEFEVTGPDRNAFVNRVTCNDVGALESGGVQYSGDPHARGHLRRRLHRLPLRRQAHDRGQRVEPRQGVGAHRRPEGRGQHPAQGHLGRRRAARGAGPERRGAAPAAHRRPALRRSATTTSPPARSRASDCFISRTGYTGEDGFELYCRGTDTVDALGGAHRGRRRADRTRRPRLAPAGDGLRALRHTRSTTPSRRSRPGSAGS